MKRFTSALSFIQYLLLPIMAVSASPMAGANEVTPMCFEFRSEENPQRISESFVRTIAESESFFDSQVWCYLESGEGETFLFNNDEPEIRPELALLIQQGPHSEETTFTSGVRIRGQLKQVKTEDPGFSPFNVPLDELEAQSSGRAVAMMGFGAYHQKQINQVIESFRRTRLKTSRNLGVMNFTEEERLPERLHPYDAYWWPHRDVPLAAGDHSPLGKYDRAVQARTGRNPGAVDWEKRVHSLEHVDWGGHCNGWAASSVLYEKWATRLWDPETETVIQPSDVDGIRAEASFCVQWAFYGQRYRSGGDIADIYPDKFHKVLRYYLKYQQKPIATDYVVGESVDNNVITGYHSSFTAIADRPGWYDVVTRLQMHEYGGRHEDVQRAKMYENTYSYRLQMDERGNILSGEWVDPEEHPDFLWVPLAQKNCGRENPYIDPDYLERWLASLPQAEWKYVPLNLEFSDSMAAGSKVTLPLPVTLKGLGFRVEFDGSGYTNSLAIRARGEASQYPLIRDASPAVSNRERVRNSPIERDFAITNMDALIIHNRHEEANEATSPLKIKGVWYWGEPSTP
ncbi:MAG: hypothetical protein H6624_03390 [Bdellovibrionaceae bacterium]|nr:hypothetical protein [Bdellovibrionales bacterium]MCB9083358.1 hypothetical protein [Pseudobdellovibrionaceae bacterium]